MAAVDLDTDVLASSTASLPKEEADEDDEPGPKFVLEVEFDSRRDLQRARRGLKKVGSGDLGVGLLALLEG